MKIRSKALFAYLSEVGVLNGTPEQIAYAKLQYRKRYKQNWKQQKQPHKELRIELALKQFNAIKTKAEQMAIGHTTYARNIVLASIDEPTTPPDTLLVVLQAVSMAAIAIEQGKPVHAVHELVRKAEITLLQYLTM